MSTARAYSQLVTADQWTRCAHEGTALLPDGSVELTWTDSVPADDPSGPGCAGHDALQPEPGGLAFDAWCRAYRSRPGAGLVHLLPAGVTGQPADACTDERRGAFDRPTGLAVDRRQRLYVVERGSGTVRVVDLREQRLLRRVAMPRGRAVDVAADCGRALVLTRDGAEAGLVVLDGRRGPLTGPRLERPCYPPGAIARRVTSGRVGADDDPCLLVLWVAPDGRSVVARTDGSTMLELHGVTDVELSPRGRLVVALGPGRPLRDFRILDGVAIENEPLRAPGFDGGSVAVAPHGRVAFTTADGFAWTAGSAARRLRHGRVLTYRLDSRSYRTRWGRAFLEACVPAGTALTLRFVTTDEDVVLDPVLTTPPVRGALVVANPTATPTMVSEQLLAAARSGPALAPYRRPGGTERPWPRPDQQGDLDTWEIPVHADPGRYLWVEIVLEGTGALTPRFRELRVERPGHRLLQSLPRSWSREEADAAFLHRFLTGAEGMLHEADRRAADRGALVHPDRVPREALAWLASFAGLTLDERIPQAARRTLVAETFRLYRRRGTLGCLVRILEICLGYPPAIIESWRLRGLAGTVLGTRPLGDPAEVIGGAAQTASLGRFSVGGGTADATTYDATAHRFTVIVPGCLDVDTRAVVDDVLDAQRPAHTLVEICELGDGMRVGQTVRPGLTSYVGPTARPRLAVVGRAGVGVDSVSGWAPTGARLRDLEAEGVRVG